MRYYSPHDIWPHCAVCDKPVEWLQRLPDSPCDRLMRFIVRCHGAEERGEIDFAVFDSALSIGPGVAFRQQRTLPPS